MDEQGMDADDRPRQGFPTGQDAAAALVAARLYFPLKCDKMHMFFDRGTMPLNGKRDERHE